MVYKVNYFDNTSDFVYHLMTLMVRKLFWNSYKYQLLINYDKPRCVSCNKKTIVNVIQNMPLSIWANFTFFCYLYFMLAI